MNKPATKVRKIYLAADALWDLRQGTLTRISPDFAAMVTSRTEYYTREEDLFGVPGNMLDKKIYQEVFDKFKHEIIRASLRTEIVPFVQQLCKEYVKQAFVTPFLDDFGIELNLYPFKFSDKEKESLMRLMQEFFGKGVEVSVIEMAPQDLTIRYARDNYASMIMYNYHDWLNLHNEQLKKVKLLDVALYVPRVYFLDKTQITDEVQRELKKQKRDLFDFTEQFLGTIVSIHFLPVALFCAATPVNVPSLRQLVRVKV